MKLSYHGHAVVRVETDDHIILFDPFMTGNELCDLDPETVKADVILLTHGHNDHVGDTETIAKNNDALVVATNELAIYLGQRGLNTHPMNTGGGYQFDFGHVKLTKAFHSSAYEESDGSIIYTGMPNGILLTIGDKTIYHVGDTDLFSDLKLIGDNHDIAVAFVPIGDNFTMGPDEALVATDWIKADTVVPVHYNTFPAIKQDPQAFAVKVKTGTGKVMQTGEVMTL